MRIYMANIKTYKIEMKLSGRMTQIPDSQKIFGAMIYLYSEYESSEQAADLVRKIKEGRFFVSLSNMMPQDCFPVPQPFLLDKVAEISQDDKSQTNRKLIYNQIKKRQFLNKEQLVQIMDNPLNSNEIYPYISIESSQQIHAAIDSLSYDIPGLDPNLYSVPEITLVKVGRSSEQEQEDKKQQMKDFYFYISIHQGELEENLLKVLKAAKEDNYHFFLGPRVSQGLNIFSITGIEKEPLSYESQTKDYLNMGMLLPNRINYQFSTLKLYTSERRPYNQSDGWDKQMEKQFISFIQAGSMINIDLSIEEAGKSIESPYDSQAIVFGNAFLYPISELYK